MPHDAKCLTTKTVSCKNSEAYKEDKTRGQGIGGVKFDNV